MMSNYPPSKYTECSDTKPGKERDLCEWDAALHAFRVALAEAIGELPVFRHILRWVERRGTTK